MPTGGATGDATGLLTGSGSAPGTSAGGVCWTGGADEAATIQSLTERVTQLEEKMAQLFGADWETSQVSNGAAQLGWITGITYMGVPGWTQTEYGSLIPPAGFSLSTNGFTMSDGSTWPAVVMDEDGVLQYGFGGTDADGNFIAVGGSSVPAQDILVLSASAQTLTFGEFIEWEDELASNGSAMSWSGSTITLPVPGTYLISLQMISASWDTGSGMLYMRINTQIDSTNLASFGFPDDAGNLPDNVMTAMIHKSLGDTSSCRFDMRNGGDVVTAAWTVVVTKLANF